MLNIFKWTGQLVAGWIENAPIHNKPIAARLQDFDFATERTEPNASRQTQYLNARIPNMRRMDEQHASLTDKRMIVTKPDQNFRLFEVQDRSAWAKYVRNSPGLSVRMTIEKMDRSLERSRNDQVP